MREIRVLRRINDSEWGAPTFCQPKKNSTIRILTDLRELNKLIRRKPFPIPKVQEMLLNLEGFTYATSIDLNMGTWATTTLDYPQGQVDSVLWFSLLGSMNT